MGLRTWLGMKKRKPRKRRATISVAPAPSARAMDQISFKAPKREPGRLVFEFERLGKADSIYFTVPDDFVAHPDCCAAAIATICAKDAKQITFDFPISGRCRDEIGRRTGAEVMTAAAIEPRKAGSKIGLCFSGGLDSFCAYLMAPADQVRIGVDWGPRFKRERAFF